MVAEDEGNQAGKVVGAKSSGAGGSGDIWILGGVHCGCIALDIRFGGGFTAHRAVDVARLHT